MAAQTPVKGLADWIWHRLTANYWSLPVTAVVIAPLFAAALVFADRDGLTAWLIDHRLAPIATSDTAKELMTTAVGVNAAFITLYFSISLLVLTIATSSLGVRLVDRWLNRRMVRVSLAGLSFTFVFGFCVLFAVDGQADLDANPLTAIAATVALQFINVAMLCVALHDLGRTMFVDRSIDDIASDTRASLPSISSTPPYTGEWAETVRAPREGYVEGIDLEKLQQMLAAHSGPVQFLARPGHHIMRGEPLALLANAGGDTEAILKAIPIGPFRSDGQGPVFRIRLLVEIAARALSPAINDFYTAIACTDRLTTIMREAGSIWVDEEQMPCLSDVPRFELPGQDFRGLFENPLHAFRQNAASYPPVTIRMIDNIGRLLTVGKAEGMPDGLREFLAQTARQWARHATKLAEDEQDRTDIAHALNGLPGQIELT